MKLTDKFRLVVLNIRRKAYEEAYDAFKHDEQLAATGGESKALEKLQQINRQILDIKRRNRKPKFTLKA